MPAAAEPLGGCAGFRLIGNGKMSCRHYEDSCRFLVPMVMFPGV